MKDSKSEKTQFKYLASILGCSTDILKSVLQNIDNYYYVSIKEKLDKNTGRPKTYKNGTIKQRVLTPSTNLLKVLQKRINSRILSKISLPKNVQGGVRGRSNITNSASHKGKKFLLCIDLQDFFPSVSNHDINKMFLDAGYSKYISGWLTRLTSYKSILPQGSPTSTVIANLVFKNVDADLIHLCGKYNITYTRFVDDLSFSAQNDFKPIIPEILDIIKQHKYKINYRKTKYSNDQLITGIEVFNNYIDAPKLIIKKALLENPSDPNRPYTNYRKNILKTNTGVKGVKEEYIKPLAHASQKKEVIQIDAKTDEPPTFDI